jgi:hypothetical protein
MREIRLYGSEGGEAKAFPTPIVETIVETLEFLYINGRFEKAVRIERV